MPEVRCWRERTGRRRNGKPEKLVRVCLDQVVSKPRSTAVKPNKEEGGDVGGTTSNASESFLAGMVTGCRPGAAVYRACEREEDVAHRTTSEEKNKQMKVKLSSIKPTVIK